MSRTVPFPCVPLARAGDPADALELLTVIAARQEEGRAPEAITEEIQAWADDEFPARRGPGMVLRGTVAAVFRALGGSRA